MKKLMMTMTAVLLAHFAGAAEAPLKALLVSGGGYHDYKSQKKILVDGIKERTEVDFKVIGDDPKAIKDALSKPNWADGYDVVVYNFCDAGQTDTSYIDGVIKTHKESGKGAVVIHCALHSYHWKVQGGRKEFSKKDWVNFMGVGSPGHGPKDPIKVTTEEAAKAHPIMKNLPAEWTTPEGELYYADFIAPTATILAKGINKQKKHQAVIWTNKSGKANVFGTSLGHHNSTMKTKNYLDLVTNGMLWSVGRLK